MTPLPLAQAKKSGVMPKSFAALTFAPARISRSAMSALAQETAQCSTVAPSP